MNSGIIQPQVPKVIILAKDNFAIAPRNGVPKHVSIATALENRDGHTEVGHLFAAGVVAKHFSDSVSAKSKEPAIKSHGHGADRCEHGLAERRAESVIRMEREKGTGIVSGVEEPLARSREPILAAFGPMHRWAA